MLHHDTCAHGLCVNLRPGVSRPHGARMRGGEQVARCARLPGLSRTLQNHSGRDVLEETSPLVRGGRVRRSVRARLFVMAVSCSLSSKAKKEGKPKKLHIMRVSAGLHDPDEFHLRLPAGPWCGPPETPRDTRPANCERHAGGCRGNEPTLSCVAMARLLPVPEVAG